MKHLQLLLAACIAVIAITSAEDEPNSNQSSEEQRNELLRDELLQESVVLQEEEDPANSQIGSLKYVTCDSTWSCEDCNTRKFCVQFWWYTGVTYFQCPTWAPYCTSSSFFAWCTANGPSGCTGETTTAASTAGSSTAVTSTTPVSTTATSITASSTTATSTTGS